MGYGISGRFQFDSIHSEGAARNFIVFVSVAMVYCIAGDFD